MSFAPLGASPTATPTSTSGDLDVGEEVERHLLLELPRDPHRLLGLVTHVADATEEHVRRDEATVVVRRLADEQPDALEAGKKESP